MSSSSAASREFDLEPADNARLASLCGPLDANLRLVETRLGVEIRRRGHAFRIKGARAAATESVLRDLFAQTKHHQLSAEQVHLCLVEHANERHGKGNGSAASNGGGENPDLVEALRSLVKLADHIRQSDEKTAPVKGNYEPNS